MKMEASELAARVRYVCDMERKIGPASPTVPAIKALHSLVPGLGLKDARDLVAAWEKVRKWYA